MELATNPLKSGPWLTLGYIFFQVCNSPTTIDGSFAAKIRPAFLSKFSSDSLPRNLSKQIKTLGILTSGEKLKRAEFVKMAEFLHFFGYKIAIQSCKTSRFLRQSVLLRQRHVFDRH